MRRRPRSRRTRECRPSSSNPRPQPPTPAHRHLMSARSFRAAVLAMFVAAAVDSASSAARAQSAVDIAQARELFNQGMDLRDKGDASGALAKLQGANALAHTPITGVELGRTLVLLAHLVEAREAFLAV